MSHIPIHPESLGRFGINIHGHLHSNVVRLNCGLVDTRYVCVSVEHTDFAPIEFHEAVAKADTELVNGLLGPDGTAGVLHTSID